MSNLPIQNNTPLLNSLLKKANSLPDANERFEAGKKSEYDRFWDAFQQNGERNFYDSAFFREYWDDTTYNPKYPIYCETSNGARQAFNVSYISSTKVPIYCISTSLSFTFADATRLKSIPLLSLENVTEYNNAFTRCPALEELNIVGTIEKNGFSVADSPLLTHDSLMSIINCLKDYAGSGTTYTVTLGATNLAKLTDAEKAIATQKGWTLA